MPEIRHLVCPVCDSPMNETRVGWRFDCPDCGYLMADLESTIEVNEPSLTQAGGALAALRHL
jgi:hypothetical protein